MLIEIYSGQYSHNGNTKLGRQVSVINREAGATCPGESEFCKHCYALKGMFVRFGIQAKYAASTIKLPGKFRLLCRIHASGDFDSLDYIAAVLEMVQHHPDTLFWAYTRSWRLPELRQGLETLRAEPNMQLFASNDPTIPEPTPDGWRVGYIETDTRQKGMMCLEQQHSAQCPPNCDRNPKYHVGKMPDCQTCGYCFVKPAGHVGFYIH